MSDCVFCDPDRLPRVRLALPSLWGCFKNP